MGRRAVKDLDIGGVVYFQSLVLNKIVIIIIYLKDVRWTGLRRSRGVVCGWRHALHRLVRVWLGREVG